MVASITLGSFVFGPTTNTYVPQYGFSSDHSKAVVSAPGYFTNSVTLSGFFRTNTHKDNMIAYNNLMAAIRKHELQLTIVDTSTIIDRVVYIDSHNLPKAWNTKIAEFEIVCSWEDTNLDVTGYTADFNGFALDPIPTISRSWQFDRNEETGPITRIPIEVILNGHFKEGSFDANYIKVQALATAMSVQSATLNYFKTAAISGKAYPSGLSHDESFATDKISYSANFRMFIPISGLPSNVIYESVRVNDRVPFQRFAAHYIPTKSGRTILPLGLSEGRFQVTGTIETDSFANTLTRISAVVAGLIPGTAILENQPSFTYDPGSARVQFQYNYSYDN